MNSALFIALRRLRAPIILLIVVYAIGVIGMVLIPGVDAAGKPWRMSFFDAFYFVSYTATTIGFGEIPFPFSYAQRLWVTAVIYMSVLAWAYAIGTIFALTQDRSFRQTLALQAFTRVVGRLQEPFYLICGLGETGMMVARALDRLDRCFVAVDIRDERIAELDLQDFRRDAPAIVGDARTPGVLLSAGLNHPKCIGILGLTSDDSANLAVAIAAKLMHPEVPVLCRALDRSVCSNMSSFGTDHIINPFVTFGELLALAIEAPAQYRLFKLMTGMPGQRIDEGTPPPRGRWIVCGYGRFGQEVVARFAEQRMDVTIIDPKPIETIKDSLNRAGPTAYVRGTGTETGPLLEAGVDDCVGIVAGTDDDVNNLSIAVTARELNPDVYVILRRNLQSNRPLFDAYGAHLTLVPSELIAHRSLAIMTTPLLSRFLARMRERSDTDASALATHIETLTFAHVPYTWTAVIDNRDSPSLHQHLQATGAQVTLDVLMTDPSDRDATLACLALMIVRDGEDVLLPAASEPLRIGDQVLFCGMRSARIAQRSIRQNVNVFDYVHSGREIPGGWVWQTITRASGKRRAAST